jgi:hypothetical protein
MAGPNGSFIEQFCLSQFEATRRVEKGAQMNLATWLPAMFFLGIVSMLLCVLFLEACERI